MVIDESIVPSRLRRLAEELDESAGDIDVGGPAAPMLLTELDIALRPPVHERRVPSFGALIAPRTDPSTWSSATGLHIDHRPIGAVPLADARRFADGLSSWLLRDPASVDAGLIFDRPTGSERDLVVLAEATGGTVVQRHPSGTVRVAGGFGVLRWAGYGWHHEPPVVSWIDTVAACALSGDRAVLQALIEFAVHDLGAQGIGAILVYRPSWTDEAAVQSRLAVPPPLSITHPTDLAPLRHALAQLDGAALFDADGTLRELGARLVPSATAEATVDGFGGMRHTSSRRYSHDDPTATLIVVSEDGPVTVIRGGEVLGSSANGLR